MSHITIYLDKQNKTTVGAVARSSPLHVGRSRAGVVRRATRENWSEEIRRLSGSSPDFPTTDIPCFDTSKDVPRVVV